MSVPKALLKPSNARSTAGSARVAKLKVCVCVAVVKSPAVADRDEKSPAATMAVMANVLFIMVFMKLLPKLCAALKN